jgi:hypothetical protein
MLSTSLYADAVRSKLMISNVQGLNSVVEPKLLDAIKTGCGAENVEVQDGRGVRDIDAALKRGKKVVLVLRFDEYILSRARSERDEQLRDNGLSPPPNLRPFLNLTLLI